MRIQNVYLIPALLSLVAGPLIAQSGTTSTSTSAGPPLTSSSTSWQDDPILVRRRLLGHRLGAAANSPESMGGAFTSGWGAFASAVPTGSPGIWHITFPDPGTGWQESFLLGVPAVPLSPAPLLVMFHQYSVSEWDAYHNTPIMKEAMLRGWYVVAPLGAHQWNYGITFAQRNIEVVLDWVDYLFPIDPTRVYGLGFSMGGGAAASYAARHHDPDHLRFAALVNHTGTVSLSHTYKNVKKGVPNPFDTDYLFGGSPADYPFEYSRCSVIDLALDGVTVDPDTDMAGNLVHLPVLDFAAIRDYGYPRTQTLALHKWLGSHGGTEDLLEPQADEHSWLTLDAQVALDFLEQHTLSEPTEWMHEVLADRSGKWFHFEVHQLVAGAFTPFRVTLRGWLNQIVIDQIDTDSIGLDTTQVLEVILGTQSGQMQTVTLPGYSVEPSRVTRNFQDTSNYLWDPVGGSVILYEYDASAYPRWHIDP